MSDFALVEITALETVTGGQTTSTTAGAGVTLPNGSGANVNYQTSTTEPSAFLRCTQQVYDQRGLLESPQSVEARQERVCAPYRAQETR